MSNPKCLSCNQEMNILNSFKNLGFNYFVCNHCSHVNKATLLWLITFYGFAIFIGGICGVMAAIYQQPLAVTVIGLLTFLIMYYIFWQFLMFKSGKFNV